eukprot:2311973-Pleurochrysis_carterae.AAC.3
MEQQLPQRAADAGVDQRRQPRRAHQAEAGIERTELAVERRAEHAHEHELTHVAAETACLCADTDDTEAVWHDQERRRNFKPCKWHGQRLDREITTKADDKSENSAKEDGFSPFVLSSLSFEPTRSMASARVQRRRAAASCSGVVQRRRAAASW